MSPSPARLLLGAILLTSACQARRTAALEATSAPAAQEQPSDRPATGGLGIRGAPPGWKPPGAPPAGSIIGAGLDPAERTAIQQVIRDHAPEVQRCYEAQLGVEPRLEGRLVMKWVIMPDGASGGAAVQADQSTVTSATLIQCVASAIQGWRFAASKAGAIAIVSYPWTLRTAPPGPGAEGAAPAR